MTSGRRIAVGVDGSEGSRRALEWAAALVEDTDGEVVAVHVFGLLTSLSPTSAVPSAGLRREVIAQLERDWSRPLAQHPVSHRCVVVDGDPVHGLLSAAIEQEADLVVVGRRGAGGRPGLLIGSTSQQLVHQADLPVVVVPPDWRPH